MNPVHSLHSIVRRWRDLPKDRIPPVIVDGEFPGCGFVQGVTVGWVVNPRISIVMQDDDMDKTYLCVVLDNHAIGTLRWHATRDFRLEIYGQQTIYLDTDPMTWPDEIRKLISAIDDAHKKAMPVRPTRTGWERLKEYFR